MDRDQALYAGARTRSKSSPDATCINATVALKWTGCLGVSKKIRLLRRGRAWTWSYALTYEVERAGEGVTVDLLPQNHELVGAQTPTVQLGTAPSA